MKRLISLCIILLLFTSCQQEAETGFVGQQFLLKADVPDEVGTFDYIWKITDLPETSELTLSDMQFSEDESQAIFIPDVVGHYIVQVTVWKYNDKLGAIAYTYDISEPSSDMATQQSTNDDWLNEAVEGDTQPIEESANDIADIGTTEEAVDELKSLDQKVDETPKVVEEIDTAVDKKKIIEEVKAVVETPAAIPPSTVQANFTIQIAADSNRESALQVVNRFTSAGFDAYIQETITSTNQTMYRIRVGKYETRDDAELDANRIQNEHGMDTWITKYQK